MDEQERQVENQWIFQQMVEPLVTWYDQNARILPWRENNAPYGVWISEIMLQQTRVETVIPYYERFMQKLPTVESLAEVGEELLLKLWEGLGYYARVRNLQKAARVICRDYQGKFPDSYQKILQLPGIGAYTAGAIVSISFGQPIAAVDGNVLRVISRLTENEQDIASPALKKEITKALETVYPRSRSGDFTQSLMELGAMICIPHGVPQCTICPVAFLCRANHHHTQLLLPVQAKKPARKRQ
ncbi:MAG: A/G-specific adenine glycosylase, partial [Clostridiales bacterium]